jgi:hypothetical protein
MKFMIISIKLIANIASLRYTYDKHTHKHTHKPRTNAMVYINISIHVLIYCTNHVDYVYS